MRSLNEKPTKTTANSQKNVSTKNPENLFFKEKFYLNFNSDFWISGLNPIQKD
jgi:hypothetical protein